MALPGVRTTIRDHFGPCGGNGKFGHGIIDPDDTFQVGMEFKDSEYLEEIKMDLEHVHHTSHYGQMSLFPTCRFCKSYYDTIQPSFESSDG